MFVLHSCNTNIIDETQSNSGQTSGENSLTEVNVKVTFNGIAVNKADYKIVSVADESYLPDTEHFTVVFNDLPQLLYVSDDSDNIIMMARKPITKDQNVIINEESTAIALASLNPLFMNVNSEEFRLVEQMIKSTESYPSYSEEIKRAISKGRDIFDVNNTELIISLYNVWEDLCNNIPEQEESSRAIFTRATNIEGINPDPLDVQLTGTEVIVRNKGLVPTYECFVFYGGELKERKLIESHESYGFLDLFNSDKTYGEPVFFNLYNEGEYKFIFDRTTDRAIDDFSRRMWVDALSMLGLYNVGTVAENSVAIIGKIVTLIKNPDTDIYDVLKAVSESSLSLGIGLEWKSVGKVLTKFIVIYNVFKGFLNELVRTIFGLTAKEQIEFCLCSYNLNITSCTESEIFKISGDKQKGFAGQMLPLPLVVGTKILSDDGSEKESSTYQKVKFEVVSGGGKLSKEFVNIEAGPKIASTCWTLGKDGEQVVKAVIVDMVTGNEISESLYFTAELSDEIKKEELIGVWELCHLKGWSINDNDEIEHYDRGVNTTPESLAWLESVDVCDYVRYEFGNTNIFTCYTWNGSSFKSTSSTFYHINGQTVILEDFGSGTESLYITKLTDTELVIHDSNAMEEYDVYFTFRRID